MRYGQRMARSAAARANQQSLADEIRTWSKARRKKWWDRLSEDQRAALLYDWSGFWARPNQVAPTNDDWFCWLILAGRGWGKTRAGAQFIIQSVIDGARHIALVGATVGDVRNVMVEGPSGIIACSPPGFVPEYEPSKRRLTWPNGAIATTYSADAPERLRGPQHEVFWADELAAWHYHDGWDQMQFGMRIGRRPRGVVTTTPRPIKVLRELVKDPTTYVTRGSTRENVGNLARIFLTKVVAKYEGTTLGRQELDAELMDQAPGALWTRPLFDGHRIITAPALQRIVVALDPSATSNEDSDEAGIVAAGRLADRFYVLRDVSAVLSPGAWAKRTVDLAREVDADRIIYESNQGGDMVAHAIRTVWPEAPLRAVHAKRGKQARAEPIQALYEQGRVSHVGVLADLEDQCCSWVPSDGGESPDRLDAMVYALTDLSTGGYVSAGNRNVGGSASRHRAA